MLVFTEKDCFSLIRHIMRKIILAKEKMQAFKPAFFSKINLEFRDL